MVLGVVICCIPSPSVMISSILKEALSSSASSLLSEFAFAFATSIDLQKISDGFLVRAARTNGLRSSRSSRNVCVSGSVLYRTNLEIDASSREVIFPLSLPAIITRRFAGSLIEPIRRIVGIDSAAEVTSAVVRLISSRNRMGVSLGWDSAYSTASMIVS